MHPNRLVHTTVHKSHKIRSKISDPWHHQLTQGLATVGVIRGILPQLCQATLRYREELIKEEEKVAKSHKRR